MTQEEKYIRLRELYNRIADQFKDLQTLSNSLVDAENQDKTVTTVKRIKDSADQVVRLYTEIDSVESEPIWEGGSEDDDRSLCGLLCDE